MKPKNSIRRALSLSFVQSFVSLIFSFGAVIIVSHLLTPSEIGVYSVAAGLVALAHMLRSFGVSEFIVQEKQLDQSLIRTVFTINLLIAWTLGVALFAFSGVIGKFYGDVGVSSVLKVLSGLFILMPFGAVTQAQMTREFEFDRLVKIRLSEIIARSCATVGLAYVGFSYMSMAWASLGSIVVTLLGCAVWGWHYRVTGLSLQHWRRVLHFGSNRTLSDVAMQIGDQSANLIVGRMLGMTDTGLYSRGYGIVNLYRDRIVGAVNSVAFPAFAKEHRETGTAPALFLRALVYLTGISWPFFAAGVLLAFPIIRILFGAQWGAAVPLMRWLCGAAIVGSLMYQCNQFLVALGRVRTVTRVEIQYQSARVIVTIAAAFFSVEAVAAVQVLVYVLATVLYYRHMHQYQGLSIRNCAHALVPSAMVTLATCVVPALVVFWPGFLQQQMVLAFCVAVIGGCIGWLLAIRLVRHPLLEEVQRMTSHLLTRTRSILGRA